MGQSQFAIGWGQSCSSPVATGALPLKQSSKSPQISGIFVKFECQAPLHKRKAPLLTTL